MYEAISFIAVAYNYLTVLKLNYGYHTRHVSNFPTMTFAMGYEKNRAEQSRAVQSRAEQSRAKQRSGGDVNL